MRIALPALVLVASTSIAARAQELHIGPFVQHVTPTSAWVVWETTAGDESRVEWGPTDALGSTSEGITTPSEGPARMHEVELRGLVPGARVHYRVHTGSTVSATYDFVTPRLASAEASFRLIAVSDMQRDRANPDVFRRVVREGILPFLGGEATIEDELAFVLVPGDLVDDGTEYESWRDEFFDPAQPLFAHVAVYPVLGNHDAFSPHYFRAFHLPVSAGSTEPERWWRFDHGNVRVIGLDSNLLLYLGEQQAFYEESLRQACDDPNIDFVFVQLHHAHQSELWPQGQAPISAAVAERTERFSRDCGKPTIQFFGHTHGYSRGATRAGRHLLVNVASAGGNIDYIGEYPEQRDFEDVSVSQDEWGFVIVDVTAGDDPEFRLRRVSLGNERVPRVNEVRDTIVVRRNNLPPATPSLRFPRGEVGLACDSVVIGAATDPDGDALGAIHVQVAASCADFSRPVFDRVRQHENWYGGVDTQAGDDLLDEALPDTVAPEGADRCVRVRVRDRGLAWSEWSDAVPFRRAATGTPTCANAGPWMARPDAGADAGDDASGRDASADAGHAEIRGGGCTCRVAQSSPPRLGLVLLACLLELVRRRRTR